MAAISKYALTFQNRLISFEQDIELVDIICSAQDKRDFLNDDTKLFRHLNPETHTSLNAIKHSDTSRRIVVTHLRNTVYSSFIKDIYEEMTSYVKGLVYEAALLSKNSSTAKRLLGEHKYSISASDILQFESLDALVMRISEDIVQALENERSTKDLIKKTCKKTDITLDEAKLDAALPYFELRHKLVHSDGKVDCDFKQQYTVFTYKNDYVVLNRQTIVDAKTAIKNLVLSIDASAISKGILRPNTP